MYKQRTDDMCTLFILIYAYNILNNFVVVVAVISC